MSQGRAVEVFGLEAGRLAQVMEGLSETDWDRPTGCTPWRVRDLLGHVRVAIAWLPGMLAADPPPRAEVSAAHYYRPDERFADDTNTTRIALAQNHAADQGSGDALAKDFTATWQHVHELCRAEPEDRVVRTRHGDAMLLSEFLLTRIVELTVHGLDLAAALDRTPWPTPEAADAVETLLLGPTATTAVRDLGWNQLTFLHKATGRTPITPTEATQITHSGLHWLTLG